MDEGWTVAEKLELIKKGRLIAQKFGLLKKVGVLSGGRLGDAGRHSQVDASMAEAELVARLGDAEHCEILIEDAVETCGLIIAPGRDIRQFSLPYAHLSGRGARTWRACSKYQQNFRGYFARLTKLCECAIARCCFVGII